MSACDRKIIKDECERIKFMSRWYRGFRYNEQISPVPWHLFKSRFHCITIAHAKSEHFTKLLQLPCSIPWYVCAWQRSTGWKLHRRCTDCYIRDMYRWLPVRSTTKKLVRSINLRPKTLYVQLSVHILLNEF